MPIYYNESDPVTGNADNNNNQQSGINRAGSWVPVDGKLGLTKYVFHQSKSADASAATATSEHVLCQASKAISLTKISYCPDAAVTANDTNFATLTISVRNADGSNQQTVAAINTKITGGTGNWVAFSQIDFGSLSVIELSALQPITLTITKSGSGVVVPGGVFLIESNLL